MSEAQAGLPYLVRFGPWARNFYLGLPACVAFLMVFQAAKLDGLVGWLFRTPILLLALFCLIPRDVRFLADGRVRVSLRLAALVPVWRRTYRKEDFKHIWIGRGDYRMAGEPSNVVDSIGLVTHEDRFVIVQSYSAGASNQPPLEQLLRDLPRLTGLGVVREGPAATSDPTPPARP